MNKFILTTLLAAVTSVSANYMSATDLQIINMQKALLENTPTYENRGSIVVTVGATNDCDFHVGATIIQDAIDSGADEVRVAIGIYNENIIINDIDLRLKGSYTTCADAVADNQTNSLDTIIDAAGSTIQISGNTQRNNVSIDHILITGEGAAIFGGGITALAADVSLDLSNVWIANNTSLLGGGISIQGGNTNIYAYNLMVYNNSAFQGGGIYCDGFSGASIFIFGGSDNGFGIFGNQATDGDGGGVFLKSGCVFSSYVGTAGGFFDFRGISANSATGNGGGIYASGGSTVNLIGYLDCAFIFCFGYDTQPVNVTNNTANSDGTGGDGGAGGDGGGIYATGTGTVVNVYNGLIANNTAHNGGGVMVADTATFFTNSTYKAAVDCWSPGSCNQITDNSAIRPGGFPQQAGPFLLRPAVKP